MSVFLIGRGGLVPLATKGLAVGQVLRFDGPGHRDEMAVVIEADGSGRPYASGQRVILLDSGHESEASATGVDRPGIGFKMTPHVLSPAELAVAVAKAKANKTRLELEAEQAEAKEATERAAEKVRLLAAYPYLQRPGTGKSDEATGAANVRKLLRMLWPDVSFRVRSKSFSGGDSIDVDWQDGPPREVVDRLADQFQECDFDGMTDSTSYRHAVWPGLFGGAKYVLCQRGTSEAAYLAVATEYGYTAAKMTPYGDFDGIPRDTGENIKREAWKRPYPKPSADRCPTCGAVLGIENLNCGCTKEE